MYSNTAKTVLAFAFAASAISPALAASDPNCEVFKQHVTDDKGNTWTEPVVSCKNEKGETENRAIKQYLTIRGAGNTPDDQIITGYGISNKGVVTTFYLGEQDKVVDVASCQTMVQNHSFWTSSAANLILFRTVITDSSKSAKRSSVFSENFFSAMLSAQNAAAAECVLKGYATIPQPVLKEKPSPKKEQEQECSPEFVRPEPLNRQRQIQI